jgi:hypothetical protein
VKVTITRIGSPSITSGVTENSGALTSISSRNPEYTKRQTLLRLPRRPHGRPGFEGQSPREGYDNEDRLPEYYLRRDGKLGSINLDIFKKPGIYEKANVTPPA